MRRLSPEYEAEAAALRGEYEFNPSDQLPLRFALERYELSDKCLAEAYRLGVDTPAGRAMLAASRDAAMVAHKHWATLQFGKADLGLPRTPGRPSGDNWSRQRRQAREHVTGKPLGGLA
jgi:hypothetical protein